MRGYFVLNLTPSLCKYFININNVLYRIVALNLNFLLLLMICFQINLLLNLLFWSKLIESGWIWALKHRNINDFFHSFLLCLASFGCFCLCPRGRLESLQRIVLVLMHFWNTWNECFSLDSVSSVICMYRLIKRSLTSEFPCIYL